MTTHRACRTTTTARSRRARGFRAHPARGRFNSVFFWVMGGYIDWHLHSHKATVFADLPPTVVELGAGVGANLRYLGADAHLIAIEPNPYMHRGCGGRPARRRRPRDPQRRRRTDRPARRQRRAVISSLVLCTSATRALCSPRSAASCDPEVGSASPSTSRRTGTPTRWVQRVLRRPWAWVFEGCSCERDLATRDPVGGFASVDLTTYRIHSPFVPFNTHIAGTAIA